MGVNEERSLLLLGIPDDCEDQEFKDAVQAALGPLGRYPSAGQGLQKGAGVKIAFGRVCRVFKPKLDPRQIPGKGGPGMLSACPRPLMLSHRIDPVSLHSPRDESSGW